MNDRADELEKLIFELLYIAGDLYDEYLASRLRAAAERLMTLAETFKVA